ncbi:acyltransferase family protein [Sporolactobacillus sp. CQH2019]|uniref:acyltransferase family protein n=1 Tax=Sporolactobacillus sp. CQH2019 TaxID=3023512 RepID=UPI0023686505|nr:acyltransferase family protein [Sporolactobacillus sp. CQH2019]MDD9148788.1 acyltransferase family protein [Sporolactobacillus sp. CQH2019]
MKQNFAESAASSSPNTYEVETSIKSKGPAPMSRSTALNERRLHRRYMPGLDGLRAIAVMAVIFYHLGISWVSGGLLGVSVFFVLSGYLITDLLVSEWERSQTIHLKHFWLRRAKRLLPGMISTVVLLLVWTSLFRPQLLGTLKGDAVAALFYVSNWWYIFHQLSYFQSYANPSLLIHFWSLAVEEQFYLIWPLFLFFAIRFTGIRKHLFFIALAGAALSALLMAALYHPDMDPSRVYYGTDTRAFSILLGAALAFIWPSQKLSTSLSRWSRIFLDLMGTLAMVMIFIMITMADEYDPFLYRGGLFVLSAATVIVIAAVAHPSTWLGKCLGLAPLRWIGARSYGIYLWQYPVIILMGNNFDSGGMQIVRGIAEVALIFLISSLSFRYIENPIRHGSFAQFREKIHSVSKPESRRKIIGGGVLGIVLCLAAIAAFAALNESNASERTAVTQHTAGVRQAEKVPAASSGGAQSSVETARAVRSHQPAQAAPVKGEPAAKAAAVSEQPVTAIGDSVMADVKPFLMNEFPKATVDAKVGRQFYEAMGIIQQLKNQGKLADAVVIELGTNGPFSMDQLTSMIREIGAARHVILVNTRVPRPWQATVNQSLQKAVSMYPNVRLVNWYAASAGHADYFEPDAVHLNTAGSKVYADLLAQSITAAKK